MGHFALKPKYVYNVHSSAKYFAAKQCKGNPLLPSHGNTQQLYIVDSEMCN